MIYETEREDRDGVKRERSEEVSVYPPGPPAGWDPRGEEEG